MKNILIATIISVFGYLKLFSLDIDTVEIIIENNINPANLEKHVNFLGSDFLKGRGTGEIGIELAAKYLANEFDKIGLIPIGNNNTYYQPIPMHSSIPRANSELIIYTDSAKIILEYSDDYLIYTTGGEAYLPVAVDMVFAGYGIIAPEFDYNDYQNLEVEGKIVVLLEGEPPSLDFDYFDGYNKSIYGYSETKQRIAAAQGAIACVFLPNPLEIDYQEWGGLILENSFEKFRLAYHPSEILSLIISPNNANFILKNSGYTFEQVLLMHKENKLQGFNINNSLSFRSFYKTRDFISSNIIGMIKGKNNKLKDTYLIISAHYDHLGVGVSIDSDSIYNGVLDNAIGVSALLNIAETFSKLNKLPERSVIFLLTTGEEAGLMGSRYYVDHPIVPLHKTIANINIDGVSFIDEVNNFIGIGSKLSTLEQFFEKVVDDNGLVIADIPEQFQKYEAFTRSDQLSFAKAGIPAIMIYEGTDYRDYPIEKGLERLINYSENIYHSPFDDLNQDINYLAAKQHVQLIFKFCHYLSNNHEIPEWKSGVPYINARLRSIAEEK